MKNICASIVFILIVFSLGKSDAQKFAPIGAEWYYDSMDSGQAPDHSEYFLYNSSKDTTVSNINCRKLEIHKYAYDNTVKEYPSLFIYGDTNEVFYYNTQFNKFCTLYKFNVTIGDTLELCSLPSQLVTDSIFKVYVDTVFYQTISNTQVKFIYTFPLPTLNGYSFSYWGLYSQFFGGLNTMLPQMSPNIPEIDGPLRCYIDTEFYYINGWPLACDYRITGINSIINDFSFSTFPNPFTTSTMLTLTNYTAPFNVNLFNELGKETSFQFHTTQQDNNTQLTIERGELPAGIYFLSITSKEKREVVKLVVE